MAVPTEPQSRYDAVQHLLSRSLWYVVAYNWLVAATVLPIALVVVWPLSGTRLPVSVFFCIAYLFLEVMAFCAERNWSRVTVSYFWMIAAPGCLIQTLCCLFRAYNEPLGCLLVSALCLGVRETIFEFVCAGRSVGGYDTKERATSALVGGFAYSALLVFAFSAAFAMLRITQAKTHIMSTHFVYLLYLLFFPVVRALSRMLLIKLTSGLALGAISDPDKNGAAAAAAATEIEAEAEPVPNGTSAAGPPLDVLVLNSDMAFVLTMFLEVPFACLLLLVPWTLTFLTVAVANALLDMAFCCVLDVLQKQQLGMLFRICGKDVKIEQWSPAYINERPTSIMATLLNGMVSPGPDRGEKARLQPPSPIHSTSPYGGALTPPTCRSRTGSGTPVGTYRSSAAYEQLPPAWQEPGSAGSGSSPMSPRVSLLLDEYDDAFIECRAGWARSEEDCSCLGVYLFQDRKLTFMNHLLGNTLALALAAACVPLFRLRFLSMGALTLRIVVLVLLRICTDLAACVLLRWVTKDVLQDKCLSIWERRHELATFHGWLFRVLAGISPLFALILALAPWEAQTQTESHRRAEPHRGSAFADQQELEISRWGYHAVVSLSRFWNLR